MIPLGARLPFCLDVTRATFQQLDLLLCGVWEGLDGSHGAFPPPHQDQECMAISLLNLLQLQVWCGVVCHLGNDLCTLTGLSSVIL